MKKNQTSSENLKAQKQKIQHRHHNKKKIQPKNRRKWRKKGEKKEELK